MAIRDIPEFIEVGPGDLIRAEDWNGVQQQMRESLRTHHHSRQIDTDGIADGAITASKMAPGSVTQANIAASAVNTTQLADRAVTTAKIADNQVTGSKLLFNTVKAGSVVLASNGSTEALVQSSAPSTKTTIYFPTLSLIGTATGGFADVTAQMVYKQTPPSTGIDVYVRLVNTGSAQTTIFWQVLTFA